jgi:diguanylate cyclase (GGDEF)-like protein
LLALMVLRERGIWNMYGLRRGGSIALQILLTAWVAREHLTPITEALYSPLINHPALVGSSIPQVGMLLMLASVALGLVACVVRRSATEAGLAAAVAAMAIACDNIGSANVFQVFTGAAALILTIAVLQDAYRLAFHDELTGLPGRRALNERLLALGRHYTIAMVDVDHFKDVNDEHGHDFGDQVLRMVAARLARARGGGRAYRYGGEEFVVVFAGRSLGEAVPRLEALRKEIEGYRMTLRAPDRPRVREAQRSKARNPQPAPTIVVTVSIGVAERNERNPTPSAVLQAADKALYRAKGKGRNQTCW